MLNQSFSVNLTVYLFLGITCVLSANGQDAGFQFARVWYESHPGFRESAWATDYPTAEYNLHEAISRTTGLQLEGTGSGFTRDPNIFEYAVLEPGLAY